MMREVGADAVCLNELDSCTTRTGGVFQLERIARAMGGWDYRFGRAMPYRGGKLRRRRHDPRAHPRPFHRRPAAGEGAEPRVLTVVELARYVIATTHLDRPSAAAQRDQVAVINRVMRERYAEASKPVFLGGDLNALPDSGTLRALQEAWTVLTPTDGGTYPSHDPKKCIDYILQLDNGVTCETVGARVLHRFEAGDAAPRIGSSAGTARNPAACGKLTAREQARLPTQIIIVTVGCVSATSAPATANKFASLPAYSYLYAPFAPYLMRDLIQVICENLDRTIEVEMGTSLLDIQRQYLPRDRTPLPGGLRQQPHQGTELQGIHPRSRCVISTPHTSKASASTNARRRSSSSGPSASSIPNTSSTSATRCCAASTAKSRGATASPPGRPKPSAPAWRSWSTRRFRSSAAAYGRSTPQWNSRGWDSTTRPSCSTPDRAFTARSTRWAT